MSRREPHGLRRVARARRTALAVAFVLAVPMAFASEQIDNCATLLGSIAVELRYAHALPSSSRTTFICPRDTSALIGSGRQRILDSLGTPDATVATDDAQGQARWSYFFTGDKSAGRGSGVPELVFTFDDSAQVIAIHCGPSL